jgi:hypothetical protein
MKVYIFKQPFLIYAGDLVPSIYNDKKQRKNFKELNGKDWGASIIAVGRITRAVNIVAHMARPLMEYGVEK